MLKLETPDGNIWIYEDNDLDGARRDQYIFGGKLSEVDILGREYELSECH